MIPDGAPGLLYRPRAAQIDRNGDSVVGGQVVRPTSPGTYIGPLKGILMGGPSASTALQRGEYSDTTGKFGIPLANPYRVQYDDRIVIGDATWRVTSRPDWDFPNSMSGTKPTYAWVAVEETGSGR